jgi:hypothetical protein
MIMYPFTLLHGDADVTRAHLKHMRFNRARIRIMITEHFIEQSGA